MRFDRFLSPALCTICGEELCSNEPVYEVGNAYMCQDCLLEYLGCTEEDLSVLVAQSADIFVRTAYEVAVA